eukprot:5406926-Heterocapsa_arctica.AAC.1
MATGIINSILGTKLELLKALLDTEPRVFRTLGPYTATAGPPQGGWPEERPDRSRSSDQRGRGGK